MKKQEIAKRIARQSGVSRAEAADQVDRAVHRILADLRRGGKTSLPGLGTFTKDGTALPSLSAQRTARARPKNEAPEVEQLANVVIEGLAGGNPVEIDGLGVFYPDAARGFRFEPLRLPQVFIAYAAEDAVVTGRLCDALQEAGFSPWMDSRKLLPGQNWPRAIESAIELSDFFVACFSHHSVDKKGGFQAEIRYGIDCARRMPLDEIFLTPVRLDDCRVPRSIQRELQYIDLFPDWPRGIRRLTQMMRRGTAWKSRWR